MHTKTVLSILFVLLTATIWGQNQFAFYKNSTELYSSSTKGKTALLGKGVKIKRNKIRTASTYYSYSTMPKEVLNKIPIAAGMGFYSAIQSADGKNWLFVERNMDNGAYHLCAYDAERNTKNILVSPTNSPDTNYAFRPVAWSGKRDVIYIEALVFGSASENEGIWSYNISTRQFAKLSITSAYLTTPVISPDGKCFIYGATADVKGPESTINRIYIYDRQKNKETLLQKDDLASFSVVGWLGTDSKKSDILQFDEKDPSQVKKNNSSSVADQVNFKLPWTSGSAFCVSRTGSLLPNMNFPSACAAATCGPHTGDHGYQAIDFPIPLQTNILAVASGTVVFAWFNATGTQTLTGGYGNLVKIKHSDNTYSYYAHLNAIGVKVGDVVAQGVIIGKSGNTGHSSGPHLHFEWRDANEAKFNNDDYWPVFSEYNCTPNQNKQYTSQNVAVTGPSSFSLNCANAVPLTCGQAYNGQTTGKQSSSNNVTTGDFSAVSSNPYTSWNDPGPEDIYSLTTTGTGDITATLSNYAEGLDLDVFILTGCNVTNNPGNVIVTSNVSTMTNAPAGTYYILVDGYGSMYPGGQGNTSYNGHYGSYTLTVTCSCPTAPVAPNTLTAAIAGNNQTLLSWAGSMTNVSNMELERATNAGGPFSLIAATGTSQSYTDTTGIPGTTYFYRVRSCCSSNCSGYSNVASILSCAYAVAPTGIVASANNICIGESISVNVEGGSPGTGGAWIWRTGQCTAGSMVGTGTATTVVPTTSGFLFVQPEGTNCGPAINCASVYITVNPYPTINLGANIAIVQGGQAVLGAPANPGLTYQWSTGATTPTITVNTAGSYTVTVTNSAGCTASDTVIVSATTSTNDPSDAFKIFIRPNPTSDILLVTCEGSPTSLLQVIDNLGKVVLEDHSMVSDGATRTLHLGRLPAGRYNVRLVGKGFSKTVVVVKY